MNADKIIRRARLAAGLTQGQMAARAGTSRTAVTAYEQARKSPTLDTLVRLLEAAGAELQVARRPDSETVPSARVPKRIPDSLPRLDLQAALADVRLPLRINWSEPGRTYRLRDRGDRARVYEAVLREGDADDVATYIDGALLADLWPDLVLPRSVRDAWAPLLQREGLQL